MLRFIVKPRCIMSWLFKQNSIAPRLYDAVVKGNIVKVTELLKKASNDDVNAQDIEKYNPTPLLVAAETGQIEILCALLEHPGIDVNLRRKFYPGYTPLTVAVRYGRIDVVEALLAHKCIDVNALNEDGSDALINASFLGQAKIVRMLLDRPEINVSLVEEDGSVAFTKAARYNWIHVMKVLLTHPRISVNVCSELWLKPPVCDDDLIQKGNTALMEAALGDREDCIYYLLAQPGLDVNKTDHKGCTALTMAARDGRVNVVHALMCSQRADPNMRSEEGLTALMYASAKGHTEVVRTMLNYDCVDLTILDKNGKTAADATEKAEIYELFNKRAHAIPVSMKYECTIPDLPLPPLESLQSTVITDLQRENAHQKGLIDSLTATVAQLQEEQRRLCSTLDNLQASKPPP